jgi:hypothetical protein
VSTIWLDELAGVREVLEEIDLRTCTEPRPAAVPASRRGREDSYRAASSRTPRFQRVLKVSGLLALVVAAATLLMGVDVASSKVIFLAAMYGMAGSVMVIGGSVKTATGGPVRA